MQFHGGKSCSSEVVEFLDKCKKNSGDSTLSVCNVKRNRPNLNSSVMMHPSLIKFTFLYRLLKIRRSTALPCSFFVNVPEMNIVVGGFYLKKEIFFREIEEKFACMDN